MSLAPHASRCYRSTSPVASRCRSGGRMMQRESTLPTPQERAAHSYRWVILGAVCLIGFMTVGSRATVSSFLKTIITDLHTNRETVSFIVAINIWLSGLLQPFAGYCMD